MTQEAESEPERRDFHHPYTPYDIQETFMSTVYQVLEEGKVGILESPTGTGKSLSLICGSLTWLRDHKRRAFEGGLDWGPNVSEEPEWIITQAKARKRREMLRHREEMEERLSKIRAKEKALKVKYVKGDQSFKKRKTGVEDAKEGDNEEQFVLEDYDSGDEYGGGKKGDGMYSAATLELMEKLGMGPNMLKQEDEEVEDEVKIFYCSRTHSQLTQFINELRRIKLPAAIASNEADQGVQIEDLKHLTLGSRKNLCINPKVNKLNSVTAINDRCAELQKSGTSQEHKCQFLPNKENRPLVNDFRDHALASLRDIEDMASLGKTINICPYYASRAAIRPAEIVTLPYPLLLQKSAREALGISLKGHVIIIDEAHNLMDAIASIHGIEVSLRQLKTARAQLGIYLQKFRNRLKGKNRIYVTQVVRVIDSLVGYLDSRIPLQQADGVVSDKELLAGKNVDQINLFKLLRYLQESKIARKVEGYLIHKETSESLALASKTKSQKPPQLKPASSTPVLHHIASLLSALTNPSAEGRLFFTKPSPPSEPDLITLKYMLLDPSAHFQEVVSEAKAVILAGGTMSPFSDYTSHLFPYLPSPSITTLSCGHVIPSSNLIAWNLSCGPTGKEFEFTFRHRGNTGMVDELGLALLNICSIVPDGVVVFFPSYNHLSSIVAQWSSPPVSNNPNPNTATNTIYHRLAAKKPIFTEKKDLSSDAVLAEYAHAIDTHKGGLLLSVVGGKMSEGINFSDALGRCVLIVGLPFPNINTAEWKAKLEYIENSTITRLSAQSQSQSSPSPSSSSFRTPQLTQEEIKQNAKAESRAFYENACMRAVNQSIGRAIRHKGDYAAIVMVDLRYQKENIKAKLPGWIQGGLVEGSGERKFG
ncbi:hypothetical protein HYFRA_00013574, partial [Hymenoscyphus fraxineus]